MAKRAVGRRGRRQGRRQGNGNIVAPGRPLGHCVVKRAYSHGQLALAAGDQGFQIGVNPGATIDWSSFTAVWKRYKVLSATLHFTFSTDFDATPAIGNFIVYHDVTSAGAPGSPQEALVQKGRRILQLNYAKGHSSFSFQPLPWSSTGFTMTALPSATWLPTAGSAALTSAACWGINYNSTRGSPVVQVYVELVMQFDAPA